jgi:hypothetical protein
VNSLKIEYLRLLTLFLGCFYWRSLKTWDLEEFGEISSVGCAPPPPLRSF